MKMERRLTEARRLASGQEKRKNMGLILSKCTIYWKEILYSPVLFTMEIYQQTEK